MKKLFSCVLLAATPHLALAQPDVNAPPPAATAPAHELTEEQIKKIQNAMHNVLQNVQTALPIGQRLAFAANSDNKDAIALMGGFYSPLNRAVSCREHMTMIQTTRENGKVTLTQSLDIDGIWRRKDKFSDKYLYHMKIDLESVPAVGESSSLKAVEVEDENEVRRYYLDRPEWTTLPANQSSPIDMIVAAPSLCWITTLMHVPNKPDFKVENQADGTTRVSTLSTSYKAVFNADDTLQSLTTQDESGSTAEIRFEKCQINGPVSDEELKWQVPTGAKEVPFEGGHIAFKFNFFIEGQNAVAQPLAPTAIAPGSPLARRP